MPAHSLTVTIAFLASLWLTSGATGISAEPTAPSAAVDPAYIPPNFHGSVFINVRKLLTSKIAADLKLADRVPEGSVFSALDAKNIDTVLSAGQFPTSLTNAGFAVQRQALVIRTINAIKVDELIEKARLSEAPMIAEAKAYRIGLDGAALRFCVLPDERTLLMASDEQTIAAMLAARKPVDSLLVQQIKTVSKERDFTFIAAIEPLRPVLTKLARDKPADAPFQAINDLPDQIRAFTMSFDLSAETLLQLNLLSYDEDEAAKLKAVIDEYITLAESFWALSAGRINDSLKQIGQDDLAKTIGPFAKQFFAGKTTTVSGMKVSATWKRPDATEPVLTALAEAIHSLMQPVKGGVAE